MHKIPVYLAVAAALGAASCGSEPGALRLLMDVDRTTVSATDSVALSLQLVNQTTRAMTVWSSDSYGICNHAFTVYDEQNHEANVTTAFCAAALVIGPRPVELAPGASIDIHDWWHPGETRLNGEALAPGAYRVIGRVFGDDRTITSAAVEVTLTP